MKKLIFILVTVFFLSTMTSCGTIHSIPNDDGQGVCYTLKDKKQLMEEKILNTSTKKVFAQP